MDDYKDITTSVEGRLRVRRSRATNPSCRPADLFLTRGAQSFSIILRTAGVKAFDDVDATCTGAPEGEVHEREPFGTFEPRRRKYLKAAIVLAEPVLYVHSYDKVHAEAHTTAVLRGLVQVEVPDVGIARPLQLELRGYSSTEWPESWRVRNVGKTDSHEFFYEKLKLCSAGVGNRTIDFELPVSSVLPETIDLPMGRVWYELSVRCGDVMLCKRPLKVVRINCMCSLETAEPWIVTGQQDWVRFFFLFHAQAFRIGGPVPMTVRLSHVDNVTWHQLEIRLLEDIEYSTHDAQAIRTQSRDKGVLLRKKIGGPIRTASQVEVEQMSSGAKNVPMANVNVWPPQIKSLTANSLDVGNIDMRETIVMDEKIDLRLPSCGGRKRITCTESIHHTTAYRPMHVKHFLKIIILVSRPIKATSQEITYELVLKVPIHIMSCKVREIDTVLPAYKGASVVPQPDEIFACTCSSGDQPTSAETSLLNEYWAGNSLDSCDRKPPEYSR